MHGVQMLLIYIYTFTNPIIDIHHTPICVSLVINQPVRAMDVEAGYPKHMGTSKPTQKGHDMAGGYHKIAIMIVKIKKMMMIIIIIIAVVVIIIVVIY